MTEEEKKDIIENMKGTPIKSILTGSSVASHSGEGSGSYAPSEGECTPDQGPNVEGSTETHRASEESMDQPKPVRSIRSLSSLGGRPANLCAPQRASEIVKYVMELIIIDNQPFTILD